VTPERRQTFFEGRMTLMHYPLVEDERGCLLPLEWPHLPFSPVHAFVVTASHGSVRGGHAHRSGEQLLIRIAGSIELEARHAGQTQQVCLDAHSNAVLIKAPVWARQTYRGRDATLLVFAEAPYDPQALIYESSS
jgi:dTDP-4-dehydrorhamnose 3,5-epimerase-like enzyme